MIKTCHSDVWAFDVEWVPDPVSGRLVYNLTEDVADDEVRQVMWREGGATEEDPRPYLKTALCRVVSISAVIRRCSPAGEATLQLRSIPLLGEGALDEAEILGRFLGAVGKVEPQLVGFNSNSADLPILIQRSVVHGLHQPAFSKRPDKPWEGRDYFARNSDWSVDLREALGGWGRATPSLNEMAASSGLPGKLGVDGSDVVELWREGDIDSIVAYNECDALTTYLLWLRLVHFAGLISSARYQDEQRELEELLESRGQEPDGAHLAGYLEQWRHAAALRGSP